MFFAFIQFAGEDFVSLWNIIGSVAAVFPGGILEQPHCCRVQSTAETCLWVVDFLCIQQHDFSSDRLVGSTDMILILLSILSYGLCEGK